MTQMRPKMLLILLSLIIAGCSRSAPASPPPTFTPRPGASAVVGAPRIMPGHPVVSPDCLAGLSSYRFAGTFSLEQAQGSPATPPAAGGDLGPPAGSLANLVSHVTFQGAAQAPDRYQAQITFGGSDVQPVEIRRIGSVSYSRFGTGPWSNGDALSQFGPIAQLDPQSFCQAFLTTLDAGDQTPGRETVNGVPSLRYEISNAPIGRGPASARGGEGVPTPAATARAAAAQIVIWSAERGGFPVRFQVSSSAGATFQLTVDVTDVNGRDVRITTPR
jgi:hypothetical protein